MRRAACDALALVFLERNDAVPILLRDGLVPKLLPCICDPDISVCVAATGAFRNMSVAGVRPLRRRVILFSYTLTFQCPILALL